MGFLYSQLFVKPAYPSTSCAGQTIIVTGSNTGLGKEAAKHFARLGAAKVIIAVRNADAGEKAKAEILADTKVDSKVVEVWPLDLASYSSIKSFADKAKRTLPRIDVVLENAGIAATSFSKTENGHERTIDVNVIGTFYLALLMLPQLKESAKKFSIKPRLTIVSSEVHAWTSFNERQEPNIFAALDDEKKSNMGERYQLSKLLEVLVVREWAPRIASSGVVLNMLNPGLCHSELSRDSGMGLEVLKFFLARTSEVGSRTLVASGTAGSESHGKYMSDGLVADDALSPFVQSDEGKSTGVRVEEELRQILEGIEKGVTQALQ